MLKLNNFHLLVAEFCDSGWNYHDRNKLGSPRNKFRDLIHPGMAPWDRNFSKLRPFVHSRDGFIDARRDAMRGLKLPTSEWRNYGGGRGAKHINISAPRYPVKSEIRDARTQNDEGTSRGTSRTFRGCHSHTWRLLCLYVVSPALRHRRGQNRFITRTARGNVERIIISE